MSDQQSLKLKIVEIVDDIFACTKKPITGAILAERLRSAGEDYKEAGYLKLAEPINELVESGRLARNRHVKHLEIAPPSFDFESEAATTNSKPAFDSYVREDAWPVFAMLNSNSKAVFDNEEKRFRLIGRDAVVRDSQIQVVTPSNDEHR